MSARLHEGNMRAAAGRVAADPDAGPAARDNGFTLLETLVALAILSVVSLVMFQSVITLTRVSERAGAVAAQSLDELVRRDVFTSVVAQLVPDWPDGREPGDGAFTGTARGFQGLTGHDPGAAASADGSRGLSRVGVGEDSGGLVLRVEGQPALILSGSRPLPGASPVQARAEAGRFRYLGTDGVWRADWPPESAVPFAPPGVLPFDDHQLAQPQALPVAVAWVAPDGAVWFASPKGAGELPPTSDLVLGQ
ncbi:MAG: prepilin-type N-terminal cleavage/methylation domain-containing protein [Litorimonas sp.]